MYERERRLSKNADEKNRAYISRSIGSDWLSGKLSPSTLNVLPLHFGPDRLRCLQAREQPVLNSTTDQEIVVGAG